MEKLTIKEVKTANEAQICDHFREKLQKHEKQWDSHIYCKDFEHYYEGILGLWDCYLALAYFDDKPIGYIYAQYAQSPKRNYDVYTAKVVSVYVDAEYRHRGVATKLFETVDEWLKKLCKGQEYLLSVTANSDNLDAINAYKNMGFKEYTITFRK